MSNRSLAVQQSQADIGSYISDLEDAIAAVDTLCGVAFTKSSAGELSRALTQIHSIAHSMAHEGRLSESAKARPGHYRNHRLASSVTPHAGGMK